MIDEDPDDRDDCKRSVADAPLFRAFPDARDGRRALWTCGTSGPHVRGLWRHERFAVPVEIRRRRLARFGRNVGKWKRCRCKVESRSRARGIAFSRAIFAGRSRSFRSVFGRSCSFRVSSLTFYTSNWTLRFESDVLRLKLDFTLQIGRFALQIGLLRFKFDYKRVFLRPLP